VVVVLKNGKPMLLLVYTQLSSRSKNLSWRGHDTIPGQTTRRLFVINLLNLICDPRRKKVATILYLLNPTTVGSPPMFSILPAAHRGRADGGGDDAGHDGGVGRGDEDDASMIDHVSEEYQRHVNPVIV
jgi:hypothetical protein